MGLFEGKSVLVTGCCGTVGSELVAALLTDSRYSPAEVIGVDNNESKLFFEDQRYISYPQAKFLLVDIRDRNSLVKAFDGVDVVFHTAAFKHVILCERSPHEAVATNILGVENVIAAAESNGVERAIFTSSDKAVNPTSVMGTSKLMGERLMTAANGSSSTRRTIFSSTRFGNVLGSSGSVIPIFRKQIREGGPVTLTDPGMTRFVMTIEESVRLLIDSALIARGGEVFITKMPVVRISDLAEVMIETLAPFYGHDPADIQIEVIGTKPGEKLYEELMSTEEVRRAVELPLYYSVLPAFRGFYQRVQYDYEDLVSETVSTAYNSSAAPMMSKAELKRYLLDNELLRNEETEAFRTRYWPGDKEGMPA